MLYSQPCFSSCGGRRKRLAIIGVTVSDTTADARIAQQITIANSLSRRPTIPGMNNTGMNTATSDSVIDMMVKPISFEPTSAACSGSMPSSMWRTMFSSITIASSTTKPTARVSASRDRLSMLWPKKYISPKVMPTEIGSAIEGMSVAERLRRKRKITSTTRTPASARVNFTSSTPSSIVTLRSYMTRIWMDSGTFS